MSNAKVEFLSAVADTKSEVKAALIRYYPGGNYDLNPIEVVLQVQFSEDEYEEFLTGLDFTYDSGYGNQHLFGNIWLNDGSWIERNEREGSEWWEWRTCPPLHYKTRRSCVKEVTNE